MTFSMLALLIQKASCGQMETFDSLGRERGGTFFVPIQRCCNPQTPCGRKGEVAFVGAAPEPGPAEQSCPGAVSRCPLSTHWELGLCLWELNKEADVRLPSPSGL